MADGSGVAFVRSLANSTFYAASDPLTRLSQTVVGRNNIDYGRSISSQGYDTMFPTLSPEERNARKTSEPAEFGYGSSSAGHPSLPSTSSLAPLSVETYGGETAGMGMDYVTTMLDDHETNSRSIRLAQEMALSNMRQDLRRIREEIQQMENDRRTQ
ncbi:unnamed protein product, partial [Mesorhabditis spiculigera]